MRLYSLDSKPLRAVDQWLEHYRVFWLARLQNLKRMVESSEGREA